MLSFYYVVVLTTAFIILTHTPTDLGFLNPYSEILPFAQAAINVEKGSKC